MDREDTQDGLGPRTNTLQSQSQINPNVSLNDIQFKDAEDAANVQDNNMARLFEYFLRNYVHTGTNELEEVDMDDDEYENDNDMFTSSGESARQPYYTKRLIRLFLKDSTSSEVLPVHLDHILLWRHNLEGPANLNALLYRYLVKNFLRMQDPLEEVLQNVVKDIASQFNRVPRRFYLQFLHTPSIVYPLNEIKCNMLGELICMRGQVTRVSDVRPELVRATFKCKTCGTVVGDIVQQFKYTTPTKCPSSNCLNTTDWELLMDRSYFCDWQKIRIQEVAQEAESGSMPNSLEIILRNKLVDTLNAGDRVQVSGCLIVVPDIPSMLSSTQMGEVAKKVMRQGAKRFESFLLSQGITGIKGVGAKQLNHKLSFLASQVVVVNQFRNNLQVGEIEDKFLRAEDLLNITGFEWIREVSTARDTVERLSKIIAPNVWGNYEIKKGLLLLLVGGVHKSSREAKLRGDINMCIVGDPSTAKSQFLKFVESFAPRAVYTSGKGSTAAGLTAAVFKDRDNNDYVLEAGALMYADEGICCIDEFDKMNERDRVSIHEAMEQQTISISKAGIQATLNARASVLAACNPKYGRYDTSKSFKENVNIPSPLLSRFDLLYTILDENNNQVNKYVSEYVCDRYNQYSNESSAIVKNPKSFNENLKNNTNNNNGSNVNTQENGSDVVMSMGNFGGSGDTQELGELDVSFDEGDREEVNYYKLSKWEEYTSSKYVNPNMRYSSQSRASEQQRARTSGERENGVESRKRNKEGESSSAGVLTQETEYRNGNGTQETETQTQTQKEEEMSLDELRLYIELCKRLKPLMQDSAKRKLSEYYIELRNSEVQGGRRSLRMTVRQLESLVRLSEAVAKLKFSDFVTSQHVQIAYEIFKASLLKLTNKSHIQLTFGKDPSKTQLETERSQKDRRMDVDGEGRRRGRGSKEGESSSAGVLSQESGSESQSQQKEKDRLKQRERGGGLGDVMGEGEHQGGGEEEEEMTISVEEYNAIASVLLDRVGEYELGGSLIANNELVEWYLENVLLPRTEEEANKWNLKLQQMIYRLAFVDSKLIATQAEGDPENIYRLRVHPNYFSHTHIFSQKQEHVGGLGYESRLLEEELELEEDEEQMEEDEQPGESQQ